MSRIRKELLRFVVAGVSAVLTDLITYYLLLNFFEISIAKGLSFIFGATVAFLINKYWTFQRVERSLKEIFKFSSLYLFTLGLNILTNHIVLEFSNVVILGFLFATATSTILNFIGQKWWVFKS